MNKDESLFELFEAAQTGISGSGAALCREYGSVKADYERIVLYADEKNAGFERAAKELGINFTAADKWVMVKQAVEASGFAMTVNDACRELRFKYSHIEKRVRVLLLLREANYEQDSRLTLYDVIEKWGFSLTLYDPALRMVTYLSALMTEGNEVEARNMAGNVHSPTVDKWKANPEFRLMYKEAIERSIYRLEDRLSAIAQSADKDAASVAATKILLDRLERKALGELYDTLDPDGRKQELKKRAFILAADKGTNIKEALKLEDPEEFGGLDDVNVLLPDGLTEKITADAPTHLLLQMQQLLEQYSNNNSA